MKVLYLTTMYPTPAFPQKGIFCHEQVKALKKKGVDVDVVVPIPVYDREVKQKTWEFEGINVRYVRFFKLPGARDFHRTGKNLYSVLNRVLDLGLYDVYHADTALPSGQAVMIASRKFGKPYIVHGHGLDVFLDTDYGDKPNCGMIVKAAEEVYKNSAAITCVSKKVENRIVERLTIADKCCVVYNGVDTKKFYPSQNIGNHNPIRIISVGNLIELKGHDLTIKAVSKVLHIRPKSVELDIYGKGEKEEELRKLSNKLGISSDVHFKGYIHNSVLADVYRKYDIFVLPSWYEALGCVYLEAMASGLITIGCNENGIDEVIKDGINGYLVQPHSVEDIYNKIIIILNTSKQELLAIREKATNQVQNNYTWDDSAQSLFEVYNKVCKE